MFGSEAALLSLRDENDIHDLLLNLGSEVVGIVITVALVDALQEWRRKRDDARQIAWDVLHELDHAMWVWQGGAREFDIDELLFTCDLVKDDDPFPDFTQNLLLRIGSRSENTFRTAPEKLRANKHLHAAMVNIQGLAGIRNKVGPTTNKAVAALVKSATESLALAVRVPIRTTNTTQWAGVYDASSSGVALLRSTSSCSRTGKCGSTTA